MHNLLGDGAVRTPCSLTIIRLSRSGRDRSMYTLHALRWPVPVGRRSLWPTGTNPLPVICFYGCNIEGSDEDHALCFHKLTCGQPQPQV